ncbi:cupin domain-containing protein [Intrasporangium sp.]|uniref:cupin domain-containing protein n=1 Tax=Intrasporangium sp. TaxID=1925024 RepID=UPI003221474B
MSEHDFDTIFPRGETNEAFAEYFTGQSYLHMLTTEGVVIGNVTFEPGCRNNWHIHQASSGGGQILLATAGSGWYQGEGEQPVSLLPGSVVVVPAGKKHWHGAKADSWFTHIAVAVPGEDVRNEWLEPVTDEEYARLGEKVQGA